MRLVHFKKSRRHSKRRRSNPKRHHVARRHRANPHRRASSRRYRRNPAGALKSILSPSNFMQIASVTVGFVGGAKLGGMIYDKVVPASFRKFAGLVTFALGTFAASKAKGDLLKKASAGIAAAGVYDLIAQNLPAAGLKPVSGDTISMRGVDLVGDDDGMYTSGDSIDVSGDMTELVGDDNSDRIYA